MCICIHDSNVELYNVMLQAFVHFVHSSNVYDVCVCVCVHVCACAFVVPLYCSGQLSMFNMEKLYRNKIIIIIIIINDAAKWQ